MKLLTESNIIHELHKRQMARMNEELQDTVRHQDTPYHEDTDNDIIPNNVAGTEDEDNSWLDKSFCYQCPQCDGYFASPEQLGDDEDVDCPHCGKLIVPDEIEDFDADEFEKADEEEESEDEDEEESEDEEEFEDEDEDFDESATGNIMVRSGKRVPVTALKMRRKRIKKESKLPPKPGYRRCLDADGRPCYVKVGKAAMRKAGRMAQKGTAKLQRAKSIRKRNSINASYDTENNNLPECFEMDENSVMAVMNRALKEAFSHGQEYIPFKITDITEAYYHTDTDTLELHTDILYKDDEEDTAEFELTGISEGTVTITENTGKFEIPNVSLVGTGAIINESIIIN